MLTSIRDGGTTHGNVLGFKPMRVMGVLVMLVKKEAYFAQMKIQHRLHTLHWTLLVSFD